MSGHLDKKLNILLQGWPAGVVLTSAYLAEKGYYRQLLKKYSDAGWIRKVGHGAYLRLNDELTWVGALSAIQDQLKLNVHLGGLSALEYHGFAQYISFDSDNAQVDLFNTSGENQNLPAWFKKCFPKVNYERVNLFSEEKSVALEKISGIPVMTSTPERAILEILSRVPNKFDLNHASDLVENLQLLRADEMQKMLEICLSVKVKRLFLYLSDKHNLPCFEKIDVSKIDLGTGKRVIGRGGCYVAKYLLSVPKISDDDQEAGNV